MRKISNFLFWLFVKTRIKGMYYGKSFRNGFPFILYQAYIKKMMKIELSFVAFKKKYKLNYE